MTLLGLVLLQTQVSLWRYLLFYSVIFLFFIPKAVSDISVLAMAAVNEIMGKNYIPLDFQDYLVRYLPADCPFFNSERLNI